MCRDFRLRLCRRFGWYNVFLRLCHYGNEELRKKASEQRPTITVQALKQLGLSEQAAKYVQFSIDLFSVGKSGAGMPKAKPVSDDKTEMGG